MKKYMAIVSLFAILITAHLLRASAPQSQTETRKQAEPTKTGSNTTASSEQGSAPDGIQFLTDKKVGDAYVSPLADALKQSAKDGRPVIAYFTYET